MASMSDAPMVDGKAVTVDDIMVHCEYGDVAVAHTPERGWHYLRWGYGGYGVDWHNVTAHTGKKVAAKKGA